MFQVIYGSILRCGKSLDLQYFLWTLILRILYKSSIRIWSNDCLGHFIKSISLSSNNFFISFYVCFGSWSCWKTKQFSNWKELIDFKSFSFRMTLHMTVFILLSMIFNCPILLNDKHAQFIILPPLNLIFWIVFLNHDLLHFSSITHLHCCV